MRARNGSRTNIILASHLFGLLPLVCVRARARVQMQPARL